MPCVIWSIQTYVPSYVSLDESGIRLWHVVKQKSISEIHQWDFSMDSIKAVSAAKRDERAVFLYVYQNSDDFMLHFPTDEHRKR